MLRRYTTRSAGKLTPSAQRSCQLQLQQRRHYNTTKVVSGITSAGITSTVTIGLFHLIVSPVNATVGLATIGAGAASGALAAFEGSKESDSSSSIGSTTGLVIGIMGGYYANSLNEPWR